MADPLLATLGKAVGGLLFPSETDAPFEAFAWEAAENSIPAVRRLAGRGAKEPCRSMTLPEFLRDLVDQPEYQELRRVLEATLADIRVYRFSEIDVTYYIVGTDARGRLAGLCTKSVET